MQAFWVSYCTDHILEADRVELEALVGRGFRAATDFRKAWTRVDLPAPAEPQALDRVRAFLQRYGRMEVTAKRPPNLDGAASESTPEQ